MQLVLQHSFTLLTSLGVAVAVYAALLLLSRYVIPDRILSPELITRTMRTIRMPLAWLILLITLRTFTFASGFLDDVISPQSLGKFFTISFIASVGWMVRKCITLTRMYIIRFYDVSVSDNLKARRVHTQINVVEKILVTLLVLTCGCFILLVFDRVRDMGVSILASAGVMGIVLGFAAQKSIATLFAGIQIAITQPIRVDDVVIVEGEWGWIEEINLTYIVVKIWDLRRLVLPVSWFLDRPFQNWTRVSSDILGTVFIYADYTVPLEPLRKELTRICSESALWDRKVCGLTVTDATAQVMEIRALVSAKDSSLAWDLRCLVREKLIVFLQKNYPGALPRTRVLLTPESAKNKPRNTVSFQKK